MIGGRALGLQAGRSSHLAHGSPSASRGGSASPSLSTLGRLAGRPWCPPSLLRQVLRVSYRKGRCAAMYLLAYGRSTCAELASRVDTKVSHEDTVSWKESRWRDAVGGAGRCRNPRAMRKRVRVRSGGYPVAEHAHRACADIGVAVWLCGCVACAAACCLPACLPAMPPRALARPT
jgi:hypothetical protein